MIQPTSSLTALVRIVFGMGIVCSICNPSAAQDDAAPWWNPFAPQSQSSAEPVRESSAFGGSSEDRTMFSMPTMNWPGKSNTGSAAEKIGETFDKMGQTTKRWWVKTVDFVNPFDKPATPATNGYQPQFDSRERKGPFSWLWPQSAKQRQRPTTVNDFLRQPRPGY